MRLAAACGSHGNGALGTARGRSVVFAAIEGGHLVWSRAQGASPCDGANSSLHRRALRGALQLLRWCYHMFKMAKIGRNAPCPCGSPHKYKKCCGNPLRGERIAEMDRLGPLAPDISDLLRRHEAHELIRTQQQGLGRPIISTTLKGHRLVAVANKVYFSKDWKFFTDFPLLLYQGCTWSRLGRRGVSKTARRPPSYYAVVRDVLPPATRASERIRWYLQHSSDRGVCMLSRACVQSLFVEAQRGIAGETCSSSQAQRTISRRILRADGR